MSIPVPKTETINEVDLEVFTPVLGKWRPTIEEAMDLEPGKALLLRIGKVNYDATIGALRAIVTKFNRHKERYGYRLGVRQVDPTVAQYAAAITKQPLKQPEVAHETV